MIVTFLANVANRLDLVLRDTERDVQVPITFSKDPSLERAVFRTSDKRIIRLLLSHEHVANGTIKMDYPDEAIGEYLRDTKRLGTFNLEMFDEISDAAAVLLGEH